MARDLNYRLSASFADVYLLQAAGTTIAGSASQSGIGRSLYVSNGQMVSTITDADVETASGQRAEILFPESTRSSYWYRWLMTIPTAFDDTKAMTVAQIHDTPDVVSNIRAPNFILQVNNGALECLVPATTLPAEGTSSVIAGAIPLEKGTVLDCCLHANWQTTTAGFREFFVNGVPVFRHFSTPTQYNDTVGPYLKLGLYNAYHYTGWGSRTAMYSDAQIWSGNDGYSNAMGRLPSPPKFLTYQL